MKLNEFTTAVYMLVQPAAGLALVATGLAMSSPVSTGIGDLPVAGIGKSQRHNTCSTTSSVPQL